MTPLELWHITGAAIDEHNTKIDRREADLAARADVLAASRYWAEMIAACREAAEKAEYRCTFVVSQKDVPGELGPAVAHALVRLARKNRFTAIACTVQWNRREHGEGYRQVDVWWGSAAQDEDYRKKVASGEIVPRRSKLMIDELVLKCS